MSTRLLALKSLCNKSLNLIAKSQCPNTIFNLKTICTSPISNLNFFNKRKFYYICNYLYS